MAFCFVWIIKTNKANKIIFGKYNYFRNSNDIVWHKKKKHNQTFSWMLYIGSGGCKGDK